MPRKRKPSPVRTILPRREETVPLTRGRPAPGREALIHEAFPAFARQTQGGYHYRTGVNLFYTDADGQPITETVPVQFKVGAGNIPADLRRLKAKIGTWQQTADVLGFSKRHVLYLLTGERGRLPGPRFLSRLEVVQRERGIKPTGKSPRREWLSKAWTFVRKLIRDRYQQGASGVGHSIAFVERSKRPFRPVGSIPKVTRRRGRKR